jgi:hypothetical protein
MLKGMEVIKRHHFCWEGEGEPGNTFSLKLSMQCPPDLALKTGWVECKVLASEERKSMGNRVFLVM